MSAICLCQNVQQASSARAEWKGMTRADAQPDPETHLNALLVLQQVQPPNDEATGCFAVEIGQRKGALRYECKVWYAQQV